MDFFFLCIVRENGMLVASVGRNPHLRRAYDIVIALERANKNSWSFNGFLLPPKSMKSMLFPQVHSNAVEWLDTERGTTISSRKRIAISVAELVT